MNTRDTREPRLPLIGAVVLGALVAALLDARSWFVRFAAR